MTFDVVGVFRQNALVAMGGMLPTFEPIYKHKHANYDSETNDKAFKINGLSVKLETFQTRMKDSDFQLTLDFP